MPLLRIPPFPGSVERSLGTPSGEVEPPADFVLERAICAIKATKSAGLFWGYHPSIPEVPYVLVRTRHTPVEFCLAQSQSDCRRIVVWNHAAKEQEGLDRQILTIFGPCDPWHILQRAVEVIVDADDELVLIAAIAGVPVRCVGRGPFEQAARGHSGLLEVLRGAELGSSDYRDPFTGEPITLAAAIELCAFWRRLIDSNRPIRAAIGFASWKRSTVAPLLWSGVAGVPFTNQTGQLSSGDQVAAWKSRVPAKQLDDLAAKGVQLIEVEDGFIRSVGLGADCVPPLSIIVDRLGVYFDPSSPSDLETLLEQYEFSTDLVARAARLRALIVKSGISKYEVGVQALPPRLEKGRILLVVGQVEDDRSVRCGGGPVQSNVELLRRVRQCAPDAYILYRPHPDVQAGHRVGAIPVEQLAGLADELVQSGSVSQWLEAADEVHVNTSLAGFEALLRGKPVVTHGVPFYAGWGLTRDLGDTPARRRAKRTLDELVAAVLLLYPRYLDPETGLPCPAEVLVMRLAKGSGGQAKGAVVRLRQLQGRMKRGLSALRSRVLR